MAKSQTFGKRENEKKKQAKRFEKQKRREERQAGYGHEIEMYTVEQGEKRDKRQ